MQTSIAAVFPKTILFEKWADIGFFWQGAVPLVAFERVYALLDSTNQSQNPDLTISCRLEKKDGIVWLDFKVQGMLWLTCHRCLEPMSEPVMDDYRLAIITEDDQLGLIDGADYVLFNELAGDGRMLPVADLLEDELLLALSLAMTHDDCKPPVQFAIEDSAVTRDNPFAVLAALKQH